MKIWILFCVLSVAVADRHKDESKDTNNLNIFEGMSNRPIYPFDAFNLGYDKFFSRFYPPMMAAMNKFVPMVESETFDFEGSREQSVSSKSEKMSLESSSYSVSSDSASSTKVSFESKGTSKSSEKSASVEEQKNTHSSTSNISGEKGKSTSSKSEEVSVEVSSSHSESPSKTMHSESVSEVASVSGKISESSSNIASQVSSDAIYIETAEKHSKSEHSDISEEKSEAHDVSSSNSKPDEVSGASQLPSGENKSKLDSRFVSSSSEKDIRKSASESSDIGSDAKVFILKSVEKSESESDRVSTSNEEEEDIKSSGVSSDDVEHNSAPEGNKSESDSKSVVTSVSENASSSNEKINSFSESKSVSREMGSAKSLSEEEDMAFDPTYVNDEMTCAIDESVPESQIESESDEIQYSFVEKGLIHQLTMQDVRKTLEDGYKNLAIMKKRLFKKEIAIDDLNEVIGSLQILCEKICQEVPEEYLASGTPF